MARRFAREGYVALAIDLLSREGGTAAHGSDEVPGLLGQAGPERHVADFIAGFEYLQGLDFVDGERIGMNVYPGAGHAFHNDTGGCYVQEQATRAWRDMLAWFEEYL